MWCSLFSINAREIFDLFFLLVTTYNLVCIHKSLYNKVT
jgi:hypothetical protein